MSDNRGRFKSEASTTPVRPVLAARGKTGIFASEAATNPERGLADSGKFSENALTYNPHEVPLRMRFKRAFRQIRKLELKFLERDDG